MKRSGIRLMISMRLALIATAAKRNFLSILGRYNDILKAMCTSDVMNKSWLDYQSDFDYAKDILFLDICTMIKGIFDNLNV
jgi:hypothetical protein